MRSIMGLAVGVALLALAGGSPQAQAAPAFTTKYVNYKVSGDSAAGVYVSMLKRGPHVRGEKAYAATSAESSRSACRPDLCRWTDSGPLRGPGLR